MQVHSSMQVPTSCVNQAFSLLLSSENTENSSPNCPEDQDSKK